MGCHALVLVPACSELATPDTDVTLQGLGGLSPGLPAISKASLAGCWLYLESRLGL